MNAELLRGLGLISPTLRESALEHTALQHLDRLLEEDVSCQQLLHQPIESFFHTPLSPRRAMPSQADLTRI